MAMTARMPAVATREFGRERPWTVARRLWQRRKDLRLGQREVVDRLEARAGLKTTIAAYSDWERNGTSDFALVEALALALDCNPPYLLGWTDKVGSWKPDRPLETIVRQESGPRAEFKGKRHLSALPGGRQEPRPAIQPPLLR